MGRNQVLSALFVVLVAVGGFAYTLVVGNEPLLGLDLQGGVSVVYQTTGNADEEALDQTVEIIRSRVDALGVAEPEITRQGETIVVDLPGVDEQQRAIRLVGQTAELRFRPVIFDGLPVDPTVAADGDAAPTAEEACVGALTAPENDRAEEFVLLPSREGTAQCLGPSLLTGDALETSEVGFDTREWSVNPVFEAGPDGIDAFNEVAALCFNGDPICPSRRLAIVLDHESISSPSINAPAFERDRIVISGAFEEEEARDVNTALRFGALPVELEAQATRTVSATIGDDVLRSGVTAGLIGLALVAVYLFAFYRFAGLVAIAGLVLSGLMLWTIIAWFGANQGLAISLAGIVGLIVAIGVSADSNIVYFENVKDAVADGRRVPTAVERAFQTSISTIVKADVVSLIAAVLLYFLTVGAVRGFAFYLGVATLLDLFVSYLFMRPALGLFANLGLVRSNPRWIGIRGGDS